MKHEIELMIWVCHFKCSFHGTVQYMVQTQGHTYLRYVCLYVCSNAELSVKIKSKIKSLTN